MIGNNVPKTKTKKKGDNIESEVKYNILKGCKIYGSSKMGYGPKKTES